MDGGRVGRRGFLAAAGATLSGCAAFGSSAPEFDVGMRASAFVPTEHETAVGETVVWYNNNDRAHTVTAYGDSLPEGADYFASGDFEAEAAARRGYADGLDGAVFAGETYEHAFEVPGRYDYFCVPHERAGMVGTVIVRE